MSELPHVGSAEKWELGLVWPILERFEGIDSPIEDRPRFRAAAMADVMWRYLEARHTGKTHTQTLVILNAVIMEWYEPKGLTTPPYDVPTEPPPPPPPPSGNTDLSWLRVEDNNRYFANNSGRFNWRAISAFSLLSRLLRHPVNSDEWKAAVEYVRQWLRKRRAEHFTITRVILTLDGNYWKDFRCAPDMPDYMPGLRLLTELHAQEGLYMQACYLGALEPFGGVWWPDRRDVYEGSVRTKAEQFVVEAAQVLSQYSHVVGELANEPTQIGMRHAWDNGTLVALGKKVKTVAPSMLLCGGEDNEGNGLVAPFNYADAHIDRSAGVEGWQWVKRMGEMFPVDQEGKDPNNPQHDPHLFPPGHLYAMQRIPRMPFVAGENRNMGEDRADGIPNDTEKQPSVCFGVAAVSRSRRMGGVCFHWDGGLWTTEPKNETPACIVAWHEGFDAFPMLAGRMWRGNWSPEQGNYWSRTPYPTEDDLDVVERHVRDGKGAWRVFGCEDHSVAFPFKHGINMDTHLVAPAMRKAINDQGTFSVSVYQRA